jgi:hypothetical protein
MPSPKTVKEFPKGEHKLESILLSKLSNGDKEWEEKVIALSDSPDDPPLLPGWNLQPCEEFFNKAVAYGAGGGAVLPPAQIFGGAHPVGSVTVAGIQELQLDILAYLVATNQGASLIDGGPNSGPVGLACTGRQFGIACGQLRGLEYDPWFCAVLNHGAPLTGRLATIYMPRPRVASGLCDNIPFNCTLWN